MGWVVNATSRPLYPPGKTRFPLYKRLDGPQGRSGRMRKFSPSPRSDPRTVQPVTSRYTDCAIPAHPVHLLPIHFFMAYTEIDFPSLTRRHKLERQYCIRYRTCSLWRYFVEWRCFRVMLRAIVWFVLKERRREFIKVFKLVFWLRLEDGTSEIRGKSIIATVLKWLLLDSCIYSKGVKMAAYFLCEIVVNIFSSAARTPNRAVFHNKLGLLYSRFLLCWRPGDVLDRDLSSSSQRHGCHLQGQGRSRPLLCQGGLAGSFNRHKSYSVSIDSWHFCMWLGSGMSNVPAGV